MLKGLAGFFSRTPFAILGGFGLLSLIDNVKDIPSYVGQWVDAWQAITRPVWEFLLGWIGEVPWWVSDYLTMGVVVVGCATRVFFTMIPKNELRNTLTYEFNQLLFVSLLVFAFWPMVILVVDSQRYGHNNKYRMVFFESFIWASILLALAYGLFFFEQIK